MSHCHNAEQHADRAHRFYESGQWKKPPAELKHAVAINPDQSNWYFGMGLTLSVMQRYNEATGSFQHVLRLRGDDGETMLRLGFDLIHCNRCVQAIAVLERVLEIDAHCERAYCCLILAHCQLGAHDEAELAFYMARQLVEDCPIYHDHLDRSLAIRGQFDRAIWCWQRTLELDQDHRDASPSRGAS